MDENHRVVFTDLHSEEQRIGAHQTMRCFMNDNLFNQIDISFLLKFMAETGTDLSFSTSFKRFFFISLHMVLVAEQTEISSCEIQNLNSCQNLQF